MSFQTSMDKYRADNFDQRPWLQWVVWSMVGLTLGLMGQFIIFGPFAELLSGLAERVGISSSLWRMLSSLTQIIIGFTIGMCQWQVLRSKISRAGTWVVFTSIGWTVALIVGQRLFAWLVHTMTANTATSFKLVNAILIADILVGAVSGFIIAVTQWIFLRKYEFKFARWVTINVLAWVIGLLLESTANIGAIILNGFYNPFFLGFIRIGYGFGKPIVHLYTTGNSLLGCVLSGILVGSVVSILSGYALLKLIAPSPSTAPLKVTAPQNVLWLRLISGVGILIFILGLSPSLLTLFGQYEASVRDDQFFFAASAPCSHLNWNVTPEKRLLREKESTAITVQVQNDSPQTCNADITIHTSDFSIAPETTTQSLELPPNEKGSLVWVITSRDLGTYTIAFSGGLDTAEIGISVTNLFGLTAQQVKVLSILGSFFGPALNLPWIYSVWQQRQKDKKEKEDKEGKNTDSDPTEKPRASASKRKQVKKNTK